MGLPVIGLALFQVTLILTGVVDKTFRSLAVTDQNNSPRVAFIFFLKPDTF